MTKTRGVLWECQCSCGKTTDVPSNGLTSGNNVSCGDANKHRRSERVGEIPLSYLNAVRQNATKRNLSYNVSPQFLWELFLAQGRRCALSGVLLEFTGGRNAWATKMSTTASVDRIDNDRGYEPDNVRWVHKIVNRVRWALTDNEFLSWCRLCLDYNEALVV